MDFENTFESWLSNSLSQEIPDSVRAFSFNLYEPALVDDVKFGVELIGAESFNEDDSDWACDEVWEPTTRGINIPITYSGNSWETCLERLKALVIKHLSTDAAYSMKMKSKQGVGVGFVDGDLEIVWKP
ncbi:MAG: hypothetical protein P8179_24185 [Candidatus Thiodiazotropha sp.]